MAGTVMVELPVSTETAQLLGDMVQREQMGRLVDRLTQDEQARTALLMAIFQETKTAWFDAGMTDADVDRELADFKADRRARHERGD